MKFQSLVPWGIDTSRDLFAGLQKDFFSPRIDVSETKNNVVVKAELPGLDEDKIDIEISKNILTIRGEKSVERDEKNENYHIVERSSGSFARSLSLSFEVNPDEVKASFNNGVLTINIPKPQPAAPQKNKIKITKD